jgi:2-amino-4-hydroxy-6-hydroxymethyldihydropteridine diphosphokinase
MDKKKIYISLGSNLGNRLKFLTTAKKNLHEALGSLGDDKESYIYETDSWGVLNQELYLNQVLIINSWMDDPGKILRICQNIENKLGRERKIKWNSRTLDIDILFIENVLVKETNLIIPHPEIQNRKFILVPMVQIDPNFIHPILNKSMIQLLNECADPLSVNIYSQIVH